MGNVSREMEIQRMNQKKMLQIKITVTEMKTAFDGLISRPAMAKERISDLEDISIETSKIEKQTNKQTKKMEKPEENTKDCGTTKKGVTYV